MLCWSFDCSVDWFFQLFKIGPTESMCVREEAKTNKTNEVWW